MPQYKYPVKGGAKWMTKFNYTDPKSGIVKTAYKRGFDSKREAKKYEDDFIDSLIAPEEDEVEVIRTYGDVFQEYLMSHKRADIKESSLETKFNIFNKHIFPTFEEVPIDSITDDDIANWQKKMKLCIQPNGKHFSEAYLRTIQSQFNSIINYAFSKGYLKANPLADIKNMGIKDKRVEFWTPEEYERFAYHAMEYPQYYYVYEMLQIEDGTNYGDFLLNTIENGKDNFTADELKILKDGANQIKEIEGKLTILEQKYPGCGSKPSEGESVDAESAGMVSNNSKLTKFPSFKGKDLDGNDVSSDDIFSSNKVTVINFWFTTCNPCVGELGDLEKLNKELAQKGGTVIGINSFTLGGDKTAISEAKDVLTKKGITYKNIWFDSNSEAGKFASGLYSYPTTYVVDKNGNIVGQPIVGAITSSSQAKQLNKLIDQAIENSKK